MRAPAGLSAKAGRGTLGDAIAAAERVRANRAVTIRCVVCGLEVTGIEREGSVYPSDRARPAPDAPIRDGYCMRDRP